jgi:predicted nucleotidyltransferase component of viral defense system
MPITSFEVVELFHLHFLRYVSIKLSQRSYAVKGGVCLRFFHRSPRLSADIDLDAHPQVSVNTLGKIVDTILESRGFVSNLSPQGVVSLNFRKPKQTNTTQKWKVDLLIGDQVTTTKIEFSRRAGEINDLQGTPGPELLSRYKMMPFAAKYYGAEEMTVQKLGALSADNRNALRDLFDLHHLFYFLGVDPQEIRNRVDSQTVDRADRKITTFTHRNFQEQVSPFLSESLAAMYEEADNFQRLRDQVQVKLIEIIS